ncbi:MULTISPECIES: marine proteobacterial sortase target protein [unclassified Methylobacterium]|uniref:marine proteobacterial sortase target protein n=1 Tax=unclassified Methylobacterium TaxID=2615210 RepID=UPI0011C1E2EC|nr:MULTISPECIES: marine proteobacterial sortase target protein [unclassified Methylobacterium]QEE39108.1 marine proteobacterial sortase target protein [Methylobacterium sp. WL1]TXN55665.1 marine proteobacterial sortase target protein [Methylobacterium sp. WL2]
MPFFTPRSAAEPRHIATLSPLFLALLALLVMLASAQAAPGPRRGGLTLRGSAGTAQVEAVQLATDIGVDVSGPTARTVVTQAFRNTSTNWVEGTYVYPLPEDAAVDGMKLVVGSRVIVADIRERAAAKRAYEAARAAGQSAALTTQERPNIFTNAVANIGPGETVLVQITYQQTIPVSGETRMLRLPLVVAPRYNPTPASVAAVSLDGVVEAARDPVPDRARISPPVLDPSISRSTNPVAVTVRLRAGFAVGAVRSATHAISVTETSPEARTITLANGVAPADRDLELTWAPVPGRMPGLGLFRETVAGRTYLLAAVNPPAIEADTASRPARDVIFVIDNSGSMSGASMRQAKAGLLAGLGRLTSQDRFNVIRFDDTWDALHPVPVPATPDALAGAERFVAALEARGGTEMLAPLKAALADPHAEDGRVRQVVFLTDGAVGDEEQIFAAIHANLGRSRLFMVGIGSAPNGHLMRHAAGIGRGSFTEIRDLAQVGERTRALYEKLESPAVTDLTATFSVPGVEVTPGALPDLYRGEPLVFAARLPRTAEGTVTVAGRVGGRTWSRTLPLAEADAGAGISKVWARSRIGETETTRLTGRLGADAADATILALALEHGLTTRLTALVAIDATPRRAPGTPLVAADLPLNLPAGWDFASVFGTDRPDDAPADEKAARIVPISADGAAVDLPQTGAGILAELSLGLLLALLGLLLGAGHRSGGRRTGEI